MKQKFELGKEFAQVKDIRKQLLDALKKGTITTDPKSSARVNQLKLFDAKREQDVKDLEQDTSVEPSDARKQKEKFLSMKEKNAIVIRKCEEILNKSSSPLAKIQEKPKGDGNVVDRNGEKVVDFTDDMEEVVQSNPEDNNKEDDNDSDDSSDSSSSSSSDSDSSDSSSSDSSDSSSSDSSDSSDSEDEDEKKDTTQSSANVANRVEESNQSFVVQPQRANEDGFDNNESRRVKVFVGNLPWKVTDGDIIEHFRECGEVCSIEWVTDKTTGQFYGSSFIFFDSEAQAHKALLLNGSYIHGRNIKVSLPSFGKANSATKKDAPEIPKDKEGTFCTVFIGNTPEDVTEYDLTSLFGKFGNIADIRFVYDKRTEEFRRCVFIQFSDEFEAAKSLAMNGYRLFDNRLRVDISADVSRTGSKKEQDNDGGKGRRDRRDNRTSEEKEADFFADPPPRDNANADRGFFAGPPSQRRQNNDEAPPQQQRGGFFAGPPSQRRDRF